MLQFILNNPEISIFIITSVCTLIGAAIHLYIKIWKRDKIVSDIIVNHAKDYKALKEYHDKDINILTAEIDEIKDNYIGDVKQILERLNSLSDSVSKIQGYIEGQQSKIQVLPPLSSCTKNK